MATTHELAHELQKVADSLLAAEDVQAPIATLLIWPDTKEEFIGLARALPKPLAKEVDTGSWPRFRLWHHTAPLEVQLSIPRDKVCRVVSPARPAEYECEPLFSSEDEKQFA